MDYITKISRPPWRYDVFLNAEDKIRVNCYYDGTYRGGLTASPKVWSLIGNVGYWYNRYRCEDADKETAYATIVNKINRGGCK